MRRREGIEEASLRHQKLAILQQHYASFNLFMTDMMEVLGFTPTWMQHDIAAYLQHGPLNLMIQAQRGEAKSTITAIYAVWFLIRNPKARVVIVSAGETTANEISTLIKRLILDVEVLECLRPDPSAGDRTATEAFDVHYSLKGIDKSPSVACVGIGANLPGKRADLVIADDVESPKNSQTAGMRERLANLIKEFSAWTSNDWARIVFLGTPQSTDSVYTALPSQGFDLRIWPGRYPTAEELQHYGPYLAPSLRQRLTDDPSLQMGGGLTGDKGQPTDPDLFGEDKLMAKWRMWGESGFQLQYMLNTKLMDALKFPLKLTNMIVMQGGGTRFPLTVTRGFGPQALRAYKSSGFDFQLVAPHSVSEETAELQGIYMHVDPAGGGVNGDETGYVVTGFLNGNVYILAAGGIPGGYELEPLTRLAEVAARWKPNTIGVEKNMGYGAFVKVWLPILQKHHKCAIEEEYVHGQKEARIIGTIEPVLGRGALIVMEDVIEQDDAATEKYGADKRKVYSLFYQLAKITRVRNCLKHDDRVDALEGAVRKWLAAIAIDQEKQIKKIEDNKWKKWIADPLGHKRYNQSRQGGANVFNKYRR